MTDDEAIAKLCDADSPGDSTVGKAVLRARGADAAPALARALEATDEAYAFATAAGFAARHLSPATRDATLTHARLLDIASGAIVLRSKIDEDGGVWGQRARACAIALLKGSARDASLDIFIAGLADPSPHVAAASARALAYVPAAMRDTARARATPALLVHLTRPARALTDETDLRPVAAGALGALGSVDAVPALIAALADHNYTCVCAAGALGALRDPRAVQPLIDVLNDAQKFWVPRGKAATVLGHMGRELAAAAVPSLQRALTWSTGKDAGDKWDERCVDGVRDALHHLETGAAECRLTEGYRFEMW